MNRFALAPDPKFNNYALCTVQYGSRNFLGILDSNSTIEFDPKRDSIPIFGSLQHHFTTTRELPNRPVYLNISLKMVYFEGLVSW